MDKEYSDIGWLVTAAFTGNPGRVGTGQGLREATTTAANYDDGNRLVVVRANMAEDEIDTNKRVKWRSFDEHGYPVYDGIVHIDWIFPDEDGNGFEYDHPGYNVDRWNRESIGALVVLYNAADICAAAPTMAEHVKEHTRISDVAFINKGGFDPHEWLELYN